MAERQIPSARRFKLDPIWLAGPGILYLILLLIVPAAGLMFLSFRDASGNLNFETYRQMFGAGIYVQVLVNTFSIAIQTTIACLLVGYPLAYWLARMPETRRRVVMWLVLLPFWMSALLKNFAWMVLLSRRGVLSQILTGLGMGGPVDLLYGRGVVVFAMAHTMLPLAALTMLPTLLSIDFGLARAAKTLGASGGQAFWRVVFPLSMPGVAAAGLLVFISSLGFFITPALLGSPRETVIGQLLITQVQQLLNWQLAGAIAVMLLVVTLAVCLVYDRAFGISAVSGERSDRNSNGVFARLGRLVIAGLAWATDLLAAVFDKVPGFKRRDWLLTAFCVAVMVMLLVPVLIFVPMAFGSSSFLEFPPRGYSLRWFETYWSSPNWTGATMRSFAIAIVSALLASAISSIAAFGVARSTSRVGNLAFLLFMLPMIIPNIVIAVALFYLFAQIGLVATDAGIALGHTLTALPVVFVIILTTFKSYDWRLDQAAATLGATKTDTIRKVTWPIIKGSVVAAFLFGFLHSFEELTIALFVGGGVRQTLPKQMWDDVLLQVSPTLAAASVIILAVVTIVFVAAERARPR